MEQKWFDWIFLLINIYNKILFASVNKKIFFSFYDKNDLNEYAKTWNLLEKAGEFGASIKEATESLNKLIWFLLGKEGNYSKEIDNIMKVSRVLERLKVKLLVQKNLDNYFVVDEK